MADPLAARAAEIARDWYASLKGVCDTEPMETGLSKRILAALREEVVGELVAIESHIRRPDFRQIHDIPDGDEIDSIARLLKNRAAAIREGTTHD